jgi:hypothetical protein
MIHQNNNLQLLIEDLGLEDINLANPHNYELINQLSIQVIADNNGILSIIPPFEKHPYLVEIDCSITKGLMIGTFPPISYLCDQLGLANLTFNGIISPPDLPYFHGNYSSLWKYCPINFDNIQQFARNEQPQQIKNALQENHIAYTDIISFCQRELRENNGIFAYTSYDKLLNNIVLNSSVFSNIFNCDHINRLYFTNASFFGANNRNNHLFDRYGNYILDDRDAFRLFLKGANDLGYKIEIARNEEPENWHVINEGHRTNIARRSLNKLLTTKVILRMRLSIDGNSKILQLYSAVSPAAVNRGMVRRNNCVIKFRENQNIIEEDAPRELLKEILLSFFENRIDGLINYNDNAD